MENIGGDSADRSYRYQMPRIVIKVEGKGNGIKTVFPNIYDIGIALRRDPAYITKFFGYELGALSQYNEKSRTGVVNGNHSFAAVHDHLQAFIRAYVLCARCGNPETDFGMSGDRLTMHCLACGAINQGPQAHRLTGLILKEIAQFRKQKNKGREEPAKPSRRAAPKEKHEKVAHGPDHEESSESDGKHEDEWAEDVSQEAVAARRQEVIAGLSDRVAKALLGESASKPSATAGSPKPAAPAPPAPAPIAPPVVSPAAAQPPPPNPFDAHLARSFENGIDEGKIERAAPVLKAFVSTQMAQLQLLVALQRYLNDHKMVAQAPVILKAFYDEDLLPEEVLLAWADHPESLIPIGSDATIDRAVRTAASPLIQWLKTAEEEDDDDDEEEKKPAKDSFIDSL